MLSKDAYATGLSRFVIRVENDIWLHWLSDTPVTLDYNVKQNFTLTSCWTFSGTIALIAKSKIINNWNINLLIIHKFFIN